MRWGEADPDEQFKAATDKAHCFGCRKEFEKLEERFIVAIPNVPDPPLTDCVSEVGWMRSYLLRRSQETGNVQWLPHAADEGDPLFRMPFYDLGCALKAAKEELNGR